MRILRGSFSHATHSTGSGSALAARSTSHAFALNLLSLDSFSATGLGLGLVNLSAVSFGFGLGDRATTPCSASRRLAFLRYSLNGHIEYLVPANYNELFKVLAGSPLLHPS